MSRYSFIQYGGSWRFIMDVCVGGDSLDNDISSRLIGSLWMVSTQFLWPFLGLTKSKAIIFLSPFLPPSLPSIPPSLSLFPSLSSSSSLSPLFDLPPSQLLPCHKTNSLSPGLGLTLINSYTFNLDVYFVISIIHICRPSFGNKRKVWRNGYCGLEGGAEPDNKWT